MSEPLKPYFWLQRENGSIVPLIAMDEMPHNIRVEGVARTIELHDTVGMINIGRFDSRHRQHTVVDLNKSSPRFTQARLPGTQTDEFDTDDSPRSIMTQLPVDIYEGTPPKSYGIVEQPPSDDESSRVINRSQVLQRKLSEPFHDYEPLPPWKDTSTLGPRLPAPGKKVYCSHWMSTGECDYAQQGCLYKHEMPTDLELLNKLGYRDIPKWYRERHGLGKLTATPGSGAAFGGADVKQPFRHIDWRSVDVNPPRMAVTPTLPTRELNRGNKSAAWRNTKTPNRPKEQSDSSNSEQARTTISNDNTKPINSLNQSKFAMLASTTPSLPRKSARKLQDQSRRGRSPRDSFRNKSESAARLHTPPPPRSVSSENKDSSSSSSDSQTPKRTTYKKKISPPRLSIASDIEAEFIRENDEARKSDEELYKKTVEEAKKKKKQEEEEEEEEEEKKEQVKNETEADMEAGVSE